jgi:hypothetical protein
VRVNEAAWLEEVQDDSEGEGGDSEGAEGAEEGAGAKKRKYLLSLRKESDAGKVTETWQPSR